MANTPDACVLGMSLSQPVYGQIVQCCRTTVNVRPHSLLDSVDSELLEPFLTFKRNHLLRPYFSSRGRSSVRTLLRLGLKHRV